MGSNVNGIYGNKRFLICDSKFSKLIFSKKPYPGRGNQEVMQMVTAGGRLESPNSSTPPQVFAIMIQCWNPIPDQRPSFTTIIERLGYCLQDPDVLNVNLPIFPRAPSMERDV